MRQRVTIIMSTLLNPSLLIADEVTSALDVSTQRAVGEMLVEFRDRGFVKSNRDHPRPVDPGPDRRQHPDHVRGAARREGATDTIVNARCIRTPSRCSPRCPR